MGATGKCERLAQRVITFYADVVQKSEIITSISIYMAATQKNYSFKAHLIKFFVNYNVLYIDTDIIFQITLIYSAHTTKIKSFQLSKLQ